MKKNPQIAIEVAKILDLIKEKSPGRAVELRIPPYGAIKCIKGVHHRRGTPPNQVEMTAEVLIQLAKDPTRWPALISSGQIQASGQFSDLGPVFTLISGEYQG
jgi:hypothetical protein